MNGQFLQWDTDFFGYRIGQAVSGRLDAARVRAIDAWAHEEQLDCVYFLADADHAPTTHHAEQNGYHFQDVRMTFALKRPETLPTAEGGFRLSQPGDFEALRHTAQHAYTQSRFYYDPRFTDAQCAALYETWLRRSLAEGYADAVWIADYKTKPSAYVTCHMNKATQSGLIGLVGVVPAARGQHLALRLMQRALVWFWQQGMAQIHVVTQGRNIPAQRLYQRCGFLTHTVQIWYHKWYKT